MAALTQAERDRLEALLVERGDERIALDELQGLCCALAMGPDPDPLPEYVSDVLGVEGIEPAYAPPPPELVDLLERFREAIRAALDDRSLVIEPRTLRTGRADYARWCRGFLDGIELSDTDWHDAADPGELGELLFPIEALAGALPERERAAYGPAQWRRLLHDAEEALPETIARLADYWAIVRAPPVTIRREQSKVGRNDPCPCGSGRKFKQCHGR